MSLCAVYVRQQKTAEGPAVFPWFNVQTFFFFIWIICQSDTIVSFIIIIILRLLLLL